MSRVEATVLKDAGAREQHTERKDQIVKLRTLQGWALIINAVIGLVDIANIVNGEDTPLFIVYEVLALLFIFGLPATGELQPQTGRLDQIGLWCLGTAAGIAFVVMLVYRFSTLQMNTLILLSSAIFFLVGSVVVGYVTIRAQVFPAALGWLLISTPKSGSGI
jgi:hypothetical protein